MNRSLIPLSLIAVFAMSGCLQTRTSVKESEEKQVMQKQVQSLQQMTADVRARFQDLEEDDRKIIGRLEAVEYRMSQQAANAEKGNQADSQKVKEISEKLVTYQQALTKMDQDITELRALVMQMQANPGSGGGGSSKAAAAPAGGDAFADAEALFKQSNWREAILSYEKYRKSQPKGKMVGESTYKIGVCFQELGMPDEAKAFYEEVIARFPKTREATRAATRLKSLKK